MNAKNALGFLAVGVLMKSLPVLDPSWFPGNGPDGTNASAVWLTCMGIVQAVLGGSYLIRYRLLPAIRRFGAYSANPRMARVSWRTARGPVAGV